MLFDLLREDLTRIEFKDILCFEKTDICVEEDDDEDDDDDDEEEDHDEL